MSARLHSELLCRICALNDAFYNSADPISYITRHIASNADQAKSEFILVALPTKRISSKEHAYYRPSCVPYAEKCTTEATHYSWKRPTERIKRWSEDH